jgi:hypothetical protein
VPGRAGDTGEAFTNYKLYSDRFLWCPGCNTGSSDSDQSTSTVPIVMNVLSFSGCSVGGLTAMEIATLVTNLTGGQPAIAPPVDSGSAGHAVGHSPHIGHGHDRTRWLS